jgi:hypothetical protein
MKVVAAPPARPVSRPPVRPVSRPPARPVSRPPARVLSPVPPIGARQKAATHRDWLAGTEEALRPPAKPAEVSPVDRSARLRPQKAPPHRDWLAGTEEALRPPAKPAEVSPVGWSQRLRPRAVGVAVIAVLVVVLIAYGISARESSRPAAADSSDGRPKSEMLPPSGESKPVDTTSGAVAVDLETGKIVRHPSTTADAPPSREPNAESQRGPRGPSKAVDNGKADNKTPSAADCDEVSCILDSYSGACCAKLRQDLSPKPRAAGDTAAGVGDLPVEIDRTMISDGVDKVKSRVMSCGETWPAKGQVKVSVKVGPDGHVTSVTVKSTPEAGLGNCVAGMMWNATFAKTQTGGSFAYPYTF